MQRILRIRRWGELFETAETRKLKFLKWVPVPNDQTDPGYCRLMRRADGPILFAAWIAILQAGSRCKTRGTFIEGDGTAYDVDAIAAVCQMQNVLIEKAIEVFTTEIKWLEWVTETPAGSAGDFRKIPSANRNGTGTGMEQEQEQESDTDHLQISLVQESKPLSIPGASADARKLTAILKPKTAQDRKLIAQAAVLIQTGPITPGAVWDAAEAIRNATKRIDKPTAYFRHVLSDNAKRQGHDLTQLLADCRAPPEIMAACLLRPDPRVMTSQRD